jgi:hypothetical protein
MIEYPTNEGAPVLPGISPVLALRGAANRLLGARRRGCFADTLAKPAFIWLTVLWPAFATSDMFSECMRPRRALRPEMFAKNAPVAQLDRALDYESRVQEFESLRARQIPIDYSI